LQRQFLSNFFFFPVKPQPKGSLHSKLPTSPLEQRKIIVEDNALEKIIETNRNKSRLFVLLSRVLFIVNEEDTQRFKIGMMFSSSDRASRFDRD
jgi:hypothetical protein